ncbi:uncharacterized protein LOC131672633 [Phymastichus coffea]|uniref:uncharacterized protein LOC131672633 n=1 Tax=Phymastichus coffea TaxID=108790 RepID=UPI00273CE7C0|nr:uncharacterized protein LOC131672633 [Phymastichus coffea]
MKLLLSLCAVICVTSFVCNAAGPDDVAACSRETNVDMNLLNDIKVTENYTPPENVRNFAACVYKRDGVMKEDGSLNMDFGNGKLAEVCKITNAGKDLTENVVILMKCFVEHNEAELNSKNGEE